MMRDVGGIALCVVGAGMLGLGVYGTMGMYQRALDRRYHIRTKVFYRLVERLPQEKNYIDNNVYAEINAQKQNDLAYVTRAQCDAEISLILHEMREEGYCATSFVHNDPNQTDLIPEADVGTLYHEERMKHFGPLGRWVTCRLQ